MSDSFLILHKVRGAPAFDIARRCDEMGTEDDPGPWWIIPTSGHRAYPGGWVSFQDLGVELMPDGCWAYGWTDKGFKGLLGCLYPDMPDHYPTRLAAPTPSLNLITALGIKPSIPADFKRRI